MNTRSKELLSRITHEPGLMAGRPTIRGVRFSVADVLELLASGMNIDDVLAQHPLLEREDITAALYYAASTMKGTTCIRTRGSEELPK